VQIWRSALLPIKALWAWLFSDFSFSSFARALPPMLARQGGLVFMAKLF
jgi:hypothetical protein